MPEDDRWGPCDCEADEVGTHAKFCQLRPMELTKGDFVHIAENVAAAAIDDYLFFLNEGDSSENAKECAVDQTGESSACFAGIGSCYGGGCKHG